MFKIDLKGTVWEHNHERGKRDAVAPGLPTRGRTSQRERSNGDSAPEDEIASEGEEEGDVVEAESDQPAEATKSDLAVRKEPDLVPGAKLTVDLPATDRSACGPQSW